MRPALLLAAALLTSLPALPQTRAEVEARTANAPADQRVYERYRYWVTMQPVAVQRAPDVLDKYRAWMKEQRYTEAEIESQLRAIDGHQRDLEVQLWNRTLTAEKPTFNTEPNAFLTEMAKPRKPGAALDVGMGQGRNAIWLAQQGWDVTGFDPADKAVAAAQETARRLGVRIRTEITTDDKFDWGENRWDLILLSYAGGRELRAQIERALKPGGILIVEAFHRDATKGNSIGGRVVFDTGELPALYGGLRTVRYEEPMGTADFGRRRMRLVRYCAEKPE